jgi:tRNA1(Val) A37 N6-methylase TrmN6
MIEATTADGFLNNALTVRQMRDGYRAGIDAVLLAAAVPAGSGESALELGSGAGVAALCLARRVEGVAVTGIEIDAGLVALANANAAANALDHRVTFVRADVAAMPFAARSFDHVFLNPPFHDDASTRSSHAHKSAATHGGTLAAWFAAALAAVKPRGTVTVILPPARLAEAVTALHDHDVVVFPLWPKAGAEAKRLIVGAIVGGGRSVETASGLVLHAPPAKYTAEADAVLRGAGLPLRPATG